MENSFNFFSNNACKYYPCHNNPDKADFNCIFCYCPLYALGDKCSGNFKYNKNVKDCTDCRFPHLPENYDVIVSILKKSNKRR